MIEGVVFAMIALTGVGAALAVVLGGNLIHCVLWLALVLLDTAIAFVTLDAPFLGAIQVMLYAGGVVTLMLFAIMLTRRRGGVSVKNDSDPSRRLPASIISGGLFGLIAWSILGTDSLRDARPSMQPNAKELARAFLTHDVLAFEVLSILLLGATVGAIIIARRRDFGSPEPVRLRKEPHP
jgi:NADH:ubiquinone oxidoreductase subunit 6 (subunit J)